MGGSDAHFAGGSIIAHTRWVDELLELGSPVVVLFFFDFDRFADFLMNDFELWRRIKEILQRELVVNHRLVLFKCFELFLIDFLLFFECGHSRISHQLLGLLFIGAKFSVGLFGAQIIQIPLIDAGPRRSFLCILGTGESRIAKFIQLRILEGKLGLAGNLVQIDDLRFAIYDILLLNFLN